MVSGSPGIWERAAGAEAEAETGEGTMTMVSAAGEAGTGKAEASGVAGDWRKPSQGMATVAGAVAAAGGKEMNLYVRCC